MDVREGNLFGPESAAIRNFPNKAYLQRRQMLGLLVSGRRVLPSTGHLVQAFTASHSEVWLND